MKHPRPPMLLLLLPALLAGAYRGSARATESEADAATYAWAPVEKSDTLTGTKVTGRVVPQDGALNIESARLAGRVVTILRREGERMSEGTPLYRISSAECITLAEERRVAVGKNLPELVEGVRRREQQLGLKLKGEDCIVVASHAGVLTKRSLESGASFNIGDSLATVLDTRRLTIELDVPERDQSGVRPGQAVSFQFATQVGQVYHSTIETVVPTIDPTTRTSKARLKATRLPDRLSLDALVFGDIQGEARGNAPGDGDASVAVKLPSAAVLFQRDHRYVIVDPAHPRAVAVQVLDENDRQTVVRPEPPATLKPGERVATRGAIFLLRRLVTP